MFNRRKILVVTGVFLLVFIFFSLFIFENKQPQLEVSPTILGNNYRLFIKMPHEYIDLKCSFQGQYQSPRLLKIGDGVNLYEVLLEDLSQGEHVCNLTFELDNGQQTEMAYYFTITGREL